MISSYRASRFGNTLRFPRERLDEQTSVPSHRSLKYAFPPAGVSVYFLRWDCAIAIIYSSII